MAAKFHLIIIDEGQAAVLSTLNTMADVVAALKPLLDSGGSYISKRQIFLIKGDRFYISAGPFRYLLPPNNPDGSQDNAIPLFEVPGPGAPLADGALDIDLSDDEDQADPTYKQVTAKSHKQDTLPMESEPFGDS